MVRQVQGARRRRQADGGLPRHDARLPSLDPSHQNVENYYGKGLPYSSKTDLENYTGQSRPSSPHRDDRRAHLTDFQESWDEEHPGEEFPPYNSDEYEELMAVAKERATKLVAGKNRGVSSARVPRHQEPRSACAERGGTEFEMQDPRGRRLPGSGVDLYNAMHRVAGNFYTDVQDWNVLIGNYTTRKPVRHQAAPPGASPTGT